MTFRRQIALLWGLALVPAIVCGALQLQWKADAGDRVTLETVRSWEVPALWVDARTTAQYEAGHWPEAVSLNLDEWDLLVPRFLERWSPDARIVVYCDSTACRASDEVAERIRGDFGSEQVYVLEGGWETLEGAAQ